MSTTTTLNTIEGILDGISDHQVESPILLFPNSGDEQLHIQSRERIQSIDLFNINGARMLIEQMNQTPFEFLIETAELPVGMYLVRVQLADRAVFAKWMKI